MKRSVRAISITCILSLSLAVFSGCAGKPDSKNNESNNTATTQQTPSKPKEVSLRVAWWGGDTRHKATLAAIDEYTKKNPHVKIDGEYMAYDGYQKKLMTQFAANSAPDVFQFYPSWFNDIDPSNFVDLNKYSNILDIKQFSKNLLDETTFKGKLQGLSGGVLSTTLMYNKDFFKKYGIPEETVWDWDTVIKIGKELHEKDKNVYLTTGDLDVVNRLWAYPYLSQQTGDIWIKDDYTMAFDKPVLVDTLKYIQLLYTSGTMEPLGTTTAFIGKMEQNPKWIKGEIGMIVGLTSSLATMKAANPNAQFGIAEIPLRKDAKQSANPVRSSVLFSVNARSQAVDESVKFLNWVLNDKEAALILLEQRGTPASDAARKVLVDNSKLDPLVSKAMDISNKNPGKIPNAPSENSEIWQINKDVITELAYGKTTPEQGADKIISGYTAKLKELKAAAGK